MISDRYFKRDINVKQNALLCRKFQSNEYATNMWTAGKWMFCLPECKAT